MNERELIHEMKKKKKYKEYKQQYTERFGALYYDYASIQLAFSYYTLFEILSEKECPWMKERIEHFNSILHEEGEKAVKELNDLRDEVMKTMDNITLYTDILSIYEHIMNRVEYRYKECSVPNIESSIADIQKFLFSDKDMVVTNDKIKTIISELPLRMTKQRFFDILTESLSIYKESDEAGVNGFLYMVRTIAGLKDSLQPIEGIEGIEAFIDTLKCADYSNISEEDFEQFTSQITKYGDDLTDMVNLYMQLQECINHYYTMLLCKPFAGKLSHSSENAVHMVTHILENFDGAFDTVLDGCNEDLEALEGKQESIMERVMDYEAALNDVLAECSDDSAVNALYTCSKLVSSSMFIDLEEADESTPATAEYINNATADLIADFDSFFTEHTRVVNRAVMSQVLGVVPVFFNSTEEIMEYVRYSLTHCNDTSELCACLDLINGIMV